MVAHKNIQTFALDIGYKPFLSYTFTNELIEESNDKKCITQQRKSLAGSLSKYANPSLIAKEKEIAWKLVAKDKYDLS